MFLIENLPFISTDRDVQLQTQVTSLENQLKSLRGIFVPILKRNYTYMIFIFPRDTSQYNDIVYILQKRRKFCNFRLNVETKKESVSFLYI